MNNCERCRGYTSNPYLCGPCAKEEKEEREEEEEEYDPCRACGEAIEPESGSDYCLDCE